MRITTCIIKIYYVEDCSFRKAKILVAKGVASA